MTENPENQQGFFPISFAGQKKRKRKLNPETKRKKNKLTPPRTKKRTKNPDESPSLNENLARWLFEFYGLPKPTLEWKFHPKRKWRADLAWPELMIAVEIEGGVFTRGRHTSPQGFIGDMEKYNAYSVMGILLIRILPNQVDKSNPEEGEKTGKKKILKTLAQTKKNSLVKYKWRNTPAHEIIMELFNQRGL